jgi:fluoride exporter
MLNIIAVATGGALGAVLRHFLVKGLTFGVFPLGVLSVNLIGCLLLGVFIEFLALKTNLPEPLKLFITVGLLGALTTFSTFVLDLYLLNSHSIKLVAIYLISSVFGGVICMLLGMYLVKTILKFI